MKKITDATGVVKKPYCYIKITEIEGKVPMITGLATTCALNAVENKIPSISDLVKKNRL